MAFADGVPRESSTEDSTTVIEAPSVGDFGAGAELGTATLLEKVRVKGPKRKRVLSGMRPTGRLHIGHYFGALQNWLKLQEQYDCFYFVADWHALTTHYADTSQVAENSLQVAMDWLSVGIDPAKSTIFVQSFVPEHAELHLLLSMITPLGWLERVPTYKEQIENLKDKDLGTYGFLGYPLLQGADIVMYGEPDVELLVPVGEDQVPHVELTRDVVGACNYFWTKDGGVTVKGSLFAHRNMLSAICDQMSTDPSLRAKFYSIARSKDPSEFLGTLKRLIRDGGWERLKAKTPGVEKYVQWHPVLVEPQAMLTETPRLPGTDGRRMAKSYGNFISLSESVDSIRTKARNMMTDPQRVRRTDPGRPEVCPVFAYHKLFSNAETIAWSDQGCRTAGIGCVECKTKMGENLIRWIEPIQERRREFEAHPQWVWDILDNGSAKARRVASKTMKRVRKAIFDWDGARKTSGALGPVTRAPGTRTMTARSFAPPSGNGHEEVK